MRHLIIVLFFVLFSSCHRQHDKTASAEKGLPQTSGDTSVYTVSLSPEVKVSGILTDSFSQSVLWYSYLRVMVKGRTVFHDTSDEFYLKGQPPHYRKLKNGLHEIVFLVSGRPNKDYLIYLVSNNETVVRKEMMAALDGNMPPFEKLEDNHFSDVFEAVEAICEKCDSMEYNPIISYAVTDSGIFMDSAATVKENAEYYGEFYGYDFNGSIHVKVLGKSPHKP